MSFYAPHLWGIELADMNHTQRPSGTNGYVHSVKSRSLAVLSCRCSLPISIHAQPRPPIEIQMFMGDSIPVISGCVLETTPRQPCAFRHIGSQLRHQQA